MYKIIIADDEEAVRNRLLSLLEKQKEDFEVIGSYQNGYDALEAGVSLTDLDLLITDIKMPFITGLELAKTLKETHPLLQIIILSGFDDFDFAKQAINLDAVAYLSKPLSFEELRQALAKAKERLDKSKDINRDIKKLQEHRQTLRKVEQNADLLRLCTLKNIPDKLLEKLEADGIDLKDKYISIALFDSDKEEESLTYEDIELSRFYLEENLNTTFKDSLSFFTFEPSSSLGVLFVSDKPLTRDELEGKLSFVLAKIKRSCGLSFSCAVSESSHMGEEGFSYRRLFRHTKWSLEYRTIMGEGLLLFYDDLALRQAGLGKVDDNDFKNIGYALLYGKKEEAKELSRKLIEKLGNIDYKDSYSLIINNLFDSVLKSCIALDKLYATYRPHVALINELYSKKGLESTCDFFDELIDMVLEINNGARISGLDNAFILIKKYIDFNYANSSISIESLSSELGYSSSYIFAILKKHGTTFTKLLTNRRMEEAKRLLSDSNIKMAQIAHDIGYDDPYYFSHCFKKCFGMSPLEFRKQ